MKNNNLKNEGMEDVQCTTSTEHECPKCKQKTRLDTDMGLKRVMVVEGIPYIKCGCGEVYNIKVVDNC